jgi:hypothetical protein
MFGLRGDLEMPTVDPEDFWRKTINDLTSALPENGKVAPDIEDIRPTPQAKGNQKVLVHKITTQIYVFTDVHGKVYTANTAQKMHVLGSMTLARALKIAQEDDFS